MQSTKQLTPAQLALKLVAHAKKVDDQRFWAEYEAENRRATEERLGFKRAYNVMKPHGTRVRWLQGCRCVPCQQAVDDYNEMRRQRYRELHPPKRPRRASQVVNGRVVWTVREEQHGTLTGYVYGCRCEPCKEAKRKSKPKKPHVPPSHGTPTKYRKGCRCELCTMAVSTDFRHGVYSYKSRKCKCVACRKAVASYQREYRQRKKLGV